jgi:hypothetical protein
VRQTLLLVAAVASALASGSAETPAKRPAAEIRDLLKAQADAWNRGDIVGFMQGYWNSPETEFVGASGVMKGWRAVLNRYRNDYPDRHAMGTLTFSDLEIRQLCAHSALILGKWQLRRDRDHPGGVFTLVVRRLPEGWRIINDHTSVVAGKELNEGEESRPTKHPPAAIPRNQLN